MFEQYTTVGFNNFSAGEKYTVFEFRDARFSALICYEVIFPHLVRKFADSGAQFLVNMTNDAWYGETMPYQHASMVPFRAVENRMPVVRAANTGISCVIDAKGRFAAATDLNTETSLVADITPGSEKTFYTKRGDVFAGGCVLCMHIFIGIAVYRRVREKRRTTRAR